MFRQSFFDRLTTLDILQNLELLLWGKHPPHLPYLSLLFHVVPFPPWNDSLSYPVSVSLVKKQVNGSEPSQGSERSTNFQRQGSPTRPACSRTAIAFSHFAFDMYDTWKTPMSV